MQRSVAIIAVWLAALIVAAHPAYTASMPDEKPYFLVASPDMGDPVFRHSVIMMIPPDQVHLRAGVIINEPTATSAYEIFPHLSALKDTPTSAYYGGPVDDGRPTLALRSATPPGKATQLFQDVYVSTDADTISQIVKGHPANLRIFFGRAQWLDEQLHYEILQGAWYVMPADADEAFSADPTHLWHKLVERGRLQEAHYLFPFGDTPR